MKEFLTQVLGGQSVPQFAVAIFFALIGIFVRLLLHANSRDQSSSNSPVCFQWSFLFRDNALRLFSSSALTLLLVVLTLRFSDEFLHVPLSPFIALIIGFGSDTLAEKLKEATQHVLPYIPEPIAEQVVIQEQNIEKATATVPVSTPTAPEPILPPAPVAVVEAPVSIAIADQVTQLEPAI